MSEEIITIWKATRKNGKPMHGSKALPQPENGKPGAWHDVGCDPVPCWVGVHGCRTLVDMLWGGWLSEELYVAELRGPIVDEASKVVGRSGRLCYRVEAWNEQTARLFAADCAEMVAHLHPIVELAVRVARRYAFGLASVEDLAAVRGAEWATTWVTAKNATDAAARVVAKSATDAAARVVAKSATDAAARVVAKNATDAAAWVVAKNAIDAAAWVAMWVAESGPPWDASKDAVFERMALRLHDYLTGKVDIESIRKSVE